MKTSRCAMLLIPIIFLLSCSTPYSVYTTDMFMGKKYLDETDYVQAKECFTKAFQADKNAAAAAFAATASYKLGDLPAAQRFIEEAEQLGGGHSFDGRYYPYLRIVGYKALILLKEQNEEIGVPTLSQYLQAYKYVHSGPNVVGIEVMLRKKQFDLARLEAVIDEQVTGYENDMDQFLRTGTGYYDRATRGNSAPGR